MKVDLVEEEKLREITCGGVYVTARDLTLRGRVRENDLYEGEQKRTEVRGTNLTEG